MKQELCYYCMNQKEFSYTDDDGRTQIVRCHACLPPSQPPAIDPRHAFAAALAAFNQAFKQIKGDRL